MTTLEELEKRVQALEDERSLRELLARYAFNADLGRSEAYVALYAEDGAIDGAHARHEGREELLRFITGKGHKSIEGRCQHFNCGPDILYIDGDEAVAEGYSFLLLREGSSHDSVTGLTFPVLTVQHGLFNHRRVVGSTGSGALLNVATRSDRTKSLR